MPIYCYLCQDCGEKFERFHGISQNNEEIACPKCGKKGPRRVITPVFGGGGSSSNKGNLTFPT